MSGLKNDQFYVAHAQMNEFKSDNMYLANQFAHSSQARGKSATQVTMMDAQNKLFDGRDQTSKSPFTSDSRDLSEGCQTANSFGQNHAQ